MSTTTIAPEARPSAIALEPMNANDRCDRCHAPAYVRVRFNATGFELMFCAHDYAKHEERLILSDTTIRDDRHLLLKSYKDVEASELG